MPSAWSLIDTSFPAFTGEERVRDQVEIILNYMFMLAEGLKYQLSNLSSQNFNTTALKDIQIETTADVEKALEEIVAELEQIKASTTSIQESVSKLKLWQKTADEALTDLDEAQNTLSENQQKITDDLDALKNIVQVKEDGSVAIGGEGVTLNLIGSIYINGTLIE